MDKKWKRTNIPQAVYDSGRENFADQHICEANWFGRKDRRFKWWSQENLGCRS